MVIPPSRQPIYLCLMILTKFLPLWNETVLLKKGGWGDQVLSQQYCMSNSFLTINTVARWDSVEK